MSKARQFESLRLKHAATINDEALTEETEPDFELQYVDIGNVDSSGQIHEIATYLFETAPSRARRIVRDGDVIISTVRTYLQAIAPIQKPPANLIVSTGFAVVRAQPQTLDPEFCKYAMREPKFLAEVEKRSVGVSYPAINASDLASIRIPLPPLCEQRKIADYLDRETPRLDALLSAKERLLELLDEKRRAFTIRAVTRGLNPSARMEDSSQSWLGEIPPHWKLRRIACLFRERDQRGEPDLPLLEVSINTGVMLREFSEDRIETVAADFNSYKVARKGDIAFNKMRMWQGAVGVAPVDGLVSPDYTVAMTFGDSELLPEYAEFLFRTPSFGVECARHSNGIVWDRLRLYWDGFRDIRVPVPPLDEQKAIVAAIARERDRTAEFETALRQSITLLKERRAALITAAVTGALPIPA
ncbi:MAG: restriction endonuclease subunit S [Verrucomicrobia bacterium]|nr:restriction endonuclease subunit S [Verrucomicrobiota bacterium]